MASNVRLILGMCYCWDTCDTLDVGRIRDDGALRPFQSDTINASFEKQCLAICKTYNRCDSFSFEENNQLCIIYENNVTIYSTYFL